MKINSETELYKPVKEYFEGRGYSVSAEVKSCDITAIKENKAKGSVKYELIIVELKKSFCLKLIYQALERKAVADSVYIAIPRPKSFRAKNVRMMLKLLKEIDVGLITVGLESEFKSVDVISEPLNNKKITNPKKRKSILKEIERRKTDINEGGSDSSRLVVTAYREKSAELLCIAEKLGGIITTKAAKAYADCEKPSAVLQTNYYSWFERLDRGVYKITEQGRAALKDDKLKALIEFYRKEVNNKCLNWEEMINAGAEAEESTRCATKEQMRKF